MPVVVLRTISFSGSFGPVSDKSHQLCGHRDGQLQWIGRPGNSNQRRPGDKLPAHGGPVPLSYHLHPNIRSPSTVIQKYLYILPCIRTVKQQPPTRPRARRTCRCPSPAFDPPRVATSRNKHPANTSSQSTCLSRHCPQLVLFQTSRSRRCAVTAFAPSTTPGPLVPLGPLELRRRLFRHDPRLRLLRLRHPWLPSANMSESAKWILLKQDGNKKYQAGDYEGAEALYTKACVIPLPFTGLY